MWATLRSRYIRTPSSLAAVGQQWKLGFSGLSQSRLSTSTAESFSDSGLLDLQDVEKVLSDVNADDVKVIPMKKHCDWVDYMVVATGRSTWHVKNIAQALIYKAKQKQIGAQRLMLPSMEGQEGGKWIVIDSGLCSSIPLATLVAHIHRSVNVPDKSFDEIVRDKQEKVQTETQAKRWLFSFSLL